jgi:hypothetical protein
MQPDKLIQDKIEASLNSLEGMRRAEPPPFFYTRIIGRLSNQQLTFLERFSIIITRPVIAFACMCTIVLMNVIAVYTNSESASAATDQNEIASVDEFTQVTPNFYDLENVKP